MGEKYHIFEAETQSGDYELMLDHVVCGDQMLLYLDTFLSEILVS